MIVNRRKFVQLLGSALGAATFNSLPLRAEPISPTPTLADPWLEIDLSNIAWNLQQIRNRVDGRPVMAVIKAKAYGPGLVEIGRFLARQNVRFLAVGKFDEALQLREAGVKSPILNFGSFSRNKAKEIVRRDISQSVYTDEIGLLSEAARSLNRSAKVHIKI